MNISYYISRLIVRFVQPSSIRNTRADLHAKISYGCQVVNCSIGKFSYIGELSCVLETEIGNFTSIADRCIIGGPAHAMELASTSPVFTAGRNIFHNNFYDYTFKEYSKTTILNDVWIGSGCLIKAGITIGNGAVVGMGSVVTKDIGDYEIWAGNPAHFIRKRFDDETIDELLNSVWWDKPIDQIRKNANFVVNPKEFGRKIGR